VPPELLDALRACLALGMLGPRGDTLHLSVAHPPRAEQVAARRAVLAALLRAYGPMRLYLVDDGDDPGLPRAGDAHLVSAAADLAALDATALHVGAWLLLASRHAAPLALLGGRDVYRTPVLAELCATGDLDAAVASYWDDREWLIAARPLR
jgi:hypothetical protein